MFNGFKDVESVVRLSGCRITIAVAGNHDSHILEAAVKACERGLSKAVLIGHQVETGRLLKDIGYTGQSMNLTFADVDGDKVVVAYACNTVMQKKANIPMKGIISAASFMRAILGKERGFIPANVLISQSTLFEWRGRFMILADCTVSTVPDYDDEIKVIKNAAALAKKAGIDCPRIAVLAPMEVASPKAESSARATIFTMANRGGQIKKCIIDSPLALDNVVSESAARRKGIDSEVTRYADILVVSDLNADDMLARSLIFFMGPKAAGTVSGIKIPVIMCSRVDSTDDGYHTMFIALTQLIRD